MDNKILNINIKNNSYDIVIGRDIIKNIYNDFTNYNKIMVVSDINVPKKYIDDFCENIKNKTNIVIIGDREQNKNITNVEKICEELKQNNFTRKDLVVAIGGGMVGDIAAFSASIYMRGIDFINIPTTLLSMVDSSIGGKTGINFSNIKNLIGTFYQPKKVYIDIDTLKTLNKKLFNEGLIESIKMAICFNKDFYKYIEENILYKNTITNENVSDNNFDVIENIIIESLKIKKSVVEQDEKENGVRKALNFGHTIGHGIEENCDNKFYHGECVAIGMLYMCDENIKQKLLNIYNKLNIDINIKINIENVLDTIKHDKKSENDYIYVVIVREIGSFIFEKWDLSKIKNKLEEKL